MTSHATTTWGRALIVMPTSEKGPVQWDRAPFSVDDYEHCFIECMAVSAAECEP